MHALYPHTTLPSLCDLNVTHDCLFDTKAALQNPPLKVCSPWHLAVVGAMPLGHYDSTSFMAFSSVPGLGDKSSPALFHKFTGPCILWLPRFEQEYDRGCG
jgi:hypothetical protein